ncbi:MAG: hypothetical protein Aurels2KO_41000 [Aureliella sp.]
MRFLLSFVLVLLLAPFCQCGWQDEAGRGSTGDEPASGSVTKLQRVTVEQEIPVDQLKVIVKPLTLEEVTSAADAWFAALRKQSGKIADEQLSVKRQAADAPSEQNAADKAEALERLTEMKLQQTSLIERLTVVLESMESKGGDVAEYQSYVSAQRGVNLDTADTAATLAALKGWLKSDEGGVKWAWRIANFFFILIVTRILASFISGIVKRWLDKSSHMSRLAEDLVARSIRNLLMALGLMIALTALGVDVGPLLAALGATGFIIGFALQGTLSNFASGLMILVNRPFDVGDVVEAGGVSGKVAEMNLVSTTFATFDNQKIIVPNNEIWDNVITNATAQKTRRVDLVFGVGYEDDLAKVDQLLNEIVQAHPAVLADPKPTIKVNELADSSVNFICRPWAKTEDYWTVYWDLLRTVKERFDAEGISIPYPQRDVHVHNSPLTNS